MNMSYDLLDADPEIRYAFGVTQNIGNMSEGLTDD
jgi:hypothetical protein